MELLAQGAIRCRHRGDLREHAAFPVLLVRARAAARGRLHLGDLDAALATLAQVAESEAASGRQRMMARRNRLDLLSRAGRFAEASAEAPAARALVEVHGGALDLVRSVWTQARIAAGLGDRELAKGAIAARFCLGHSGERLTTHAQNLEERHGLLGQPGHLLGVPPLLEEDERKIERDLGRIDTDLAHGEDPLP